MRAPITLYYKDSKYTKEGVTRIIAKAQNLFAQHGYLLETGSNKGKGNIAEGLAALANGDLEILPSGYFAQMHDHNDSLRRRVDQLERARFQANAAGTLKVEYREVLPEMEEVGEWTTDLETVQSVVDAHNATLEVGDYPGYVEERIVSPARPRTQKETG